MKCVVSIVAMLFVITAGAEGGRACKEDIEKFCKDVKEGGGRIVKCLKEHEAQLSEGCRGKGRQVKEAHEACKGDVEKFCKDVKPGGGAIIKCLGEHKNDLSEGCKAVKNHNNKAG